MRSRTIRPLSLCKDRLTKRSSSARSDFFFSWSLSTLSWMSLYGALNFLASSGTVQSSGLLWCSSLAFRMSLSGSNLPIWGSITGGRSRGSCELRLNSFRRMKRLPSTNFFGWLAYKGGGFFTIGSVRRGDFDRMNRRKMGLNSIKILYYPFSWDHMVPPLRWLLHSN